MMSIWEKITTLMGISEEEEYGETDDADSSTDRKAETVVSQSVEEHPISTRLKGEPRTTSKLSNQIGMPGIANGIPEILSIEPRSFEEMPQVIDALRHRKSVILNMTLIRHEEAQKSVDFVAGGTYAIDGRYERIGDNIFLFTPNCVQVNTPGNVVNEIADRQVPITPTTRSNRSTHNISTWNGEPPIQVAQ